MTHGEEDGQNHFEVTRNGIEDQHSSNQDDQIDNLGPEQIPQSSNQNSPKEAERKQNGHDDIQIAIPKDLPPPYESVGVQSNGQNQADQPPLETEWTKNDDMWTVKELLWGAFIILVSIIIMLIVGYLICFQIPQEKPRTKDTTMHAEKSANDNESGEQQNKKDGSEAPTPSVSYIVLDIEDKGQGQKQDDKLQSTTTGEDMWLDKELFLEVLIFLLTILLLCVIGYNVWLHIPPVPEDEMVTK